VFWRPQAGKRPGTASDCSNSSTRPRSSGNASALSGPGYLGHESGKLEDLFRPLGRRQLPVIAPQSSALGLSVWRPVAGALRLLHRQIVSPATHSRQTWKTYARATMKQAAMPDAAIPKLRQMTVRVFMS
jgi:hypothetical protein